MIVTGKLTTGTGKLGQAEALGVTRAPDVVPRSIGTLALATKCLPAGSGIDRFRTSGSLKVAFPRRSDAVEAIVVNTSGGLTGGDRFDVAAEAGHGSHLILTTQAAERAYRSAGGTARATTHLSAGEGARLHWLPQELILFDGCALDRRLSIDVAPSAELVVAEAVIFGRSAMGETRLTGRFSDHVMIRSQGVPVYWDRVHLDGAMTAMMGRPAVGGGTAALASLVYHGPRAEALLPLVRRFLPETGGASLVSPSILAIRLLAGDSFHLRRSLVPVLETLTHATLPKSWSL